MAPAMDRTSSTPRRRPWIGLGLKLAACASLPGCAEMKAQIWGDPTPPGVIGHPTETNDTYVDARRPRSSTVPGAMYVNGVETSRSVIARADEVGLAIRPAGDSGIPSSDPVTLQPPQTIPNPARNSATIGVPDASRLLASAERPPEMKPISGVAEAVARARVALNALTTYEVTMHRQERVNGSLLPEEDVVLAIRRTPRSVRLSWPSGANKGREVLYRADEPGGKMHVKMSNPALPRLSLTPESPMVLKNSRHPVTEAGFDSLIEGLENAVNAPAAFAIVDRGSETPDGSNRAARCLTRTTPSGERWKIYLDDETHLPSRVEALDPAGNLLERYDFRDFRANLPELASVEAFDPNARWGQPKGLLGRLAGGRDRDEAGSSPR